MLVKRVAIATTDDGAGWVELRVVPASLQREIFYRVHRDECMHLGYDKVYAALRRRFYWYNMSTDVMEWVRACATCQQIKRGVGPSRPELKQEQATKPMQRLGMDLTGPFSKTEQGNVWILVVQDYCSRWVELFPLKSKTAIEVATVIQNEIFLRYGACEKLHSDQGLEFDNEIMKDLCRRWGVEKTRTSGFAPWANGLVERTNRNLKKDQC